MVRGENLTAKKQRTAKKNYVSENRTQNKMVEI